MSFFQQKICKKFSFRSDVSNWKSVSIWGGIYYLASTLTKMLLYATIIPYGSIEKDNYTLFENSSKVVIDLIEVIYMLMALKKIKNSPEIRITFVALSWALYESLFSYGFYFIFSSTGDEFKWEYIQTGIISNIDMLDRFAIVALVDLYMNKTEKNEFSLHLLIILISKYAFNSLAFKYLFNQKSQWEIISIRLVATLAFAVMSKTLYNVFSTSEKSETIKRK